MSPAIEIKTQHLRENGPICDVTIEPSSITVDALKLEKKDIPWIKVKVLIDTGASTTAISQNVADKLKLVSRGTATVHTSAKKTEIRNEYDVCVKFDSDSYVDVLKVLGANLQDHSIDCLIGRDILSYYTLTYIGPENQFTLSFGKD